MIELFEIENLNIEELNDQNEILKTLEIIGILTNFVQKRQERLYEKKLKMYNVIDANSCKLQLVSLITKWSN